ncbi:HAD family hydrolase [Microbacterium sp. NPDC089698]|uniref:HAD family hydrolase n=1 Tax=Microbacterium sp. NPDC089698 TaxID=3364200 RepID=UPI0037FAEEBF
MNPSPFSAESSVGGDRPVLVFDFDGTIALGDGPILAYAHKIADELSEQTADLDGPRFLALVRSELYADGADSLDGYDAVRRIAEAHGAGPTLLERAYLASRQALGTPAAPVGAPAGLADLLREVDAWRILVTNAPATRIAETLAELGLGDVFDHVITAAGKPTGLGAVLDSLPDGAVVLSIGDVWRNDLAPAHERGLDTALVGPFIDPDANPTLRAADTASLIPAIRDWLTAASARPLSSASHIHTHPSKG